MAGNKDFTDKYNTQLEPADEAAFQAWADKNDKLKDLYDYDIRGAWKQGETEGGLPGGHLPDTYKKPNHPTFSDESIYHGQDGYQGGAWSTSMGRDVFTPGPTNLYSRDELKRYMDVADPDVILTEPPGKTPPETNLTSPGKTAPETNLTSSRKTYPDTILTSPGKRYPDTNLTSPGRAYPDTNLTSPGKTPPDTNLRSPRKAR